MNSPSYYKFLNLIIRVIPIRLRSIVRRYIPLTKWDQYHRILNNPYADEPPELIIEGSKYTIGIIYEYMQYHKVNIAACREMGVSYKLLDISKDDWIEIVQRSECDAFLVWPSSSLSIWKEMFDDRLKILEEDLGKIVYPSYQETWLYENKRRVRDWLKAKGILHPQTWIFYDFEEALAFARNASLPLVYKTNIGASHSGVWILRKRSEVVNIVRRSFSRGIVSRGHNPFDRQWGVVYLQEYLPNVKEWRIMRIGHSYFGYRKERVGDFHSGSGAWTWLDPPRELLNLLREVTDIGGFTSMDVDVFETNDGYYLVNELQTVFGATTPADMLRVNGKSGRYLYDSQSNQWVFDEGDYSRNMCANARLDYLINDILNRAAD